MKMLTIDDVAKRIAASNLAPSIVIFGVEAPNRDIPAAFPSLVEDALDRISLGETVLLEFEQTHEAYAAFNLLCSDLDDTEVPVRARVRLVRPSGNVTEFDSGRDAERPVLTTFASTTEPVRARS